MKLYQHHDEVQDQGKAIPHPKRPTAHTYRGRAFGPQISIDRRVFRAERKSNRETASVLGNNPWTAVGIIAALLGFHRKH